MAHWSSGGGKIQELTAIAMNDFLGTHRERRRELARDGDLVHVVLRRGNERANAVAEKTLAEVREAMGTNY